MAHRWHMGFSGEEDKRLVGQAWSSTPCLCPERGRYGGTYFLEGGEN